LNSKTVHKALSVLDVFTPDSPSWGLRDIARELNISHTIVHRLLRTFEDKGYIFQHPETQKYELGIKFIELSNVVEEHLKISELIHPIMKRIALETEESVVLTVIDNDEGLFLKIVESEQRVRFAESVGKRGPLYIGASHKMILAHLPSDVQHRIIDAGIQYQTKYIKSKDSFIKSLREIQTQGSFYTAGETFDDVAAIATPLFDSKNRILGSLSLAGPKYRLSEERAAKVLPILKANQAEINSILSKVFFPSRRDYLIKKLS
jgi:DNA-binding IclR family transcriptional regulator